LSWKGVEGALSAALEGGALPLRIRLPPNLGFEATEARATEIAKALTAICPREIHQETSSRGTPPMARS
jgi:hypothetical protein